MTTLKSLIPKECLKLVTYKGSDLIDRLGKDIISNVVSSVLCGDNIRNLTEGLTQRRILLMNSSLFVTYLKALNSIDDFTENLSKIIRNEAFVRGINKNEKTFLLWFLGLTGKSVDNVVRGDKGFASYLDSLDQNLKEVSSDIEKLYGKMSIEIDNNGIKYLMQWPSLLRCMLALGSQTLTIRGSEKSMYGKLFEKFVLGSVLTIVGGEYVNREDMSKNKMIFWLSERQDKRESDATLLLKPGYGVRFDIGFIGKGNPEISLDKVSRFEREMERGGIPHNTITIILIDTLGEGSRTQTMARNIGGYVIQMSGTYWVYQLVQILKQEYPFYNNPLLKMTKEESIRYVKNIVSNIDLAKFLTTADIEEASHHYFQ